MWHFCAWSQQCYIKREALYFGKIKSRKLATQKSVLVWVRSSGKRRRRRRWETNPHHGDPRTDRQRLGPSSPPANSAEGKEWDGKEHFKWNSNKKGDAHLDLRRWVHQHLAHRQLLAYCNIICFYYTADENYVLSTIFPRANAFSSR